MTRPICITLLTLAAIALGSDGGEDFVPKFFGGRRNDGKRAGIAPSKPRPKTRTRFITVRQEMLNFTQKLDHFNSSCRRSWTQRYLMDDQYFKANRSRPIVFIRIGGESTINESDLSSGPMIKLAKKHGALLLDLEHRFYGESRPTVDTGKSNLRLLSSKQALGDLNTFINYIRKRYFSASLTEPRIVVYGCSYAGSLAAWHRMFNPNSTLGAVARCAPMYPTANFEDYFIRVTEATAIYDTFCHYKILDLFSRWVYGAIMYDKKYNMTIVDATLNLCPPKKIDLDNPYAIDSLYYDMVSEFMQAVQYNKMSDGSNSSVGRLCDLIMPEGFAVRGYAKWMEQQNTTCLAHDGKSIVTRNATWDAPFVESGTRQWLYQMCNEFGYFTTIALNTTDSPGNETLKEYSDLSFFEKICTASFNVTNMQTRVNKTYEHYASRDSLNKLSNVVFLNGEADPWRGVGIDANFAKPTATVINVQNMSHCEEPSDLNDPSSELSTAWNNIFTIVTSWLASV